MDIKDLISEDRIIILKSNKKKDAIVELLEQMDTSIKLDDVEEVKQKLFHREELMSTGIGFGIAIPHVRCCGIENPKVAIGISHKGIDDYESMDEKPVHILVMIIAGEGQHRQYIKAMSTIVRRLKDEDTIHRLERTDRPKDGYNILTEV